MKSVREPGGNITGVRLPSPELVVRRLEILREIIPGVKRILVPYMTTHPAVPTQLEALRSAAEPVGVTVVEAPATSPAELQADLDALATSADGGVDAIITLAEPASAIPDFILVFGKFAADNKIPFCGSPPSAGDYAPMFSLMIDPTAVGEQAAGLADKILKGTAAGTIPVASPEHYLVINNKVAESLGLKVPNGVLSMAQEVIR